jgi:hypothetical protein
LLFQKEKDLIVKAVLFKHFRSDLEISLTLVIHFELIENLSQLQDPIDIQIVSESLLGYEGNDRVED